MSIKWWMDKQKHAIFVPGILFGQWTVKFWMEYKDELWKHAKARHKGQILYGSIPINRPFSRQIHSQYEMSYCQAAGVKRMRMPAMLQVSLTDDETSKIDCCAGCNFVNMIKITE